MGLGAERRRGYPLAKALLEALNYWEWGVFPAPSLIKAGVAWPFI